MFATIKYISVAAIKETGVLTRVIQFCLIGAPTAVSWGSEYFQLKHLVIPTEWLIMTTAMIILGVLLFNVANRARILDDERKSRIKIDDPVCYLDPKGAEGPCLRTYRVRVHNLSPSETARNCQVKLIRMVNKDGVPSREEGRPFKLTLNNPRDILNQPLIEQFDIKPMDWKDVDLIQLNEKEPGAQVIMRYATQGYLGGDIAVGCPVDLCPHTLTIKAVAENAGPSVDMELSYWVENGRLEMKKI